MGGSRKQNTDLTGPDQTYTILMFVNNNNISITASLFNSIYETPSIPQQWLKLVFIPIPKKNNLRKCNYRHKFNVI